MIACNSMSLMTTSYLSFITIAAIILRTRHVIITSESYHHHYSVVQVWVYWTVWYIQLEMKIRLYGYILGCIPGYYCLQVIHIISADHDTKVDECLVEPHTERTHFRR